MNELMNLKKTTELLKKVLEDRNSLDSVLEEWPFERSDESNLSRDAKWQLIYISNDEDIRSRDHSYAEKQFHDLEIVYLKINDRIAFLEGQSLGRR